MIKGKKIIAIIPARGGSKGLPGKNIKPLLGKPLIAWTIDQAKKSKYIDEIFVSTDSMEIAEVSEEYGVKVPYLRPGKLASDGASSMDVISHVISQYENNNSYFDFIILLEPTSPLRKEEDIDNSIELLVKNESADGVISVGEIHMEHPVIVKKINSSGRLEPYIDDVKKISQRQQADKSYFPYGVIYMIRTEVFRRERSLYTNNVIPYYIERWQNYEIDDIYDFIAIEAILTKIQEEQL
jgi:CMP-N,N'-diacetyllegionaminic acid synthase